jgi:hypothetical protein
MRARWILLAAAALVGVSLLAADEPWQTKPYTEWEWEDLFQLARHSPWAKEIEILTFRRRGSAGGEARTRPVHNQYGDPVGYNTVGRPHAGAVETSEPVVVQWASSLALRQARVRQGQLKGNMTAEREAELLNPPGDAYVIAVRGAYLRTFLLHKNEHPPGAILQAVYLQPKRSKRKITATKMNVFPEGQPEDLLLGDPVVWFFFPRQLQGKATIAARETKVGFTWRLGDFDLQDIHVNFDLRKMTRGGRPDY